MDINLIKAELKKRKWTYEDLARETGLNKNTITKILCGIAKYPRVDTVEAIEKALGLDKQADFSIFDIEGIEPLPTFRSIPLVGTIACGTPTLAEENIEEYIRMSENIHADFALRCRGSSMINARIFDGDIVFIRQQPDIDHNGEIAAVLIENEATLKRVYKYPNRVELRAENPTFPALNYEGTELNNIRILGKAVAFISTVR